MAIRVYIKTYNYHELNTNFSLIIIYEWFCASNYQFVEVIILIILISFLNNSLALIMRLVPVDQHFSPSKRSFAYRQKFMRL